MISTNTKKETRPKFSIAESIDQEKFCPECGLYAKEIATGNMTAYKYRCPNKHNYGVNEYYHRDELITVHC